MKTAPSASDPGLLAWMFGISLSFHAAVLLLPSEGSARILRSSHERIAVGFSVHLRSRSDEWHAGEVLTDLPSENVVASEKPRDMDGPLEEPSPVPVAAASREARQEAGETLPKTDAANHVESAAERVHALSEVEIAPRLRSEIRLDAPELRNFQRNTPVRLMLLIGASGRVEHVDVLSEQKTAVFELVAFRRFRDAEFYPGMVAGRPVPVRMTIEVFFIDPAAMPQVK